MSALSNSVFFLVAIKRWYSLWTVGCMEVGTGCCACSAQTNASIDKDDCTDSTGVSTNKCDVYFLKAGSL